MVHLATVANDEQANTKGISKLDLSDNERDAFTSSVYGSRFAAEDLPKYEMPEKEMPKEVAYRMIK
jgi:glutamate decarboxylase